MPYASRGLYQGLSVIVEGQFAANSIYKSPGRIGQNFDMPCHDLGQIVRTTRSSDRQG
jgi:hypothetical protein